MAHHLAINIESHQFPIFFLWFFDSFSTRDPLDWIQKKKKRNQSRFRYSLPETLTLFPGKATKFKSQVIASIERCV